MKNALRIVVLVVMLGILPITFGCNKKSPIITFNPKVPLIQSIQLARGGTGVEDATIFTGELISITVNATSQSVLGDCYSPGEVTTYDLDLNTPTELDYLFEIIPAPTTERTGELTQNTPPGNVAQWRIPQVDDVPGHQNGLTYTVRVSCIDNCVGLVTVGEINVSVYSDKGPPLITTLDATSRPGGDGSYVLEEIDLNGYYEIEPSDEVRMRATATSQSDASLCLGLGVTPAKSLHYVWETDNPAINITGDQDPTLATAVYFDVPDSFVAGNTFRATLRVLDTCSQAETIRYFDYMVVEPPRITVSSVVNDGYVVTFNIYTGFYEVVPAGQAEVIVNVENADLSICGMKGYDLTRSYSWTETLSSSPGLDLIWVDIPPENHRSILSFIVPAANNGTEYNLRLTATDRCNGLSATEDYPILVIVRPALGDSTVTEDGVPVTKNAVTGRYELHVGSTIAVTQLATSNSSDTFCIGRGVDSDTKLEYLWKDELDLFDFAYDTIPVPNGTSTVYFIVPPGTVGHLDTLTVTATDLCNNLSISRDFICEVVPN